MKSVLPKQPKRASLWVWAAVAAGLVVLCAGGWLALQYYQSLPKTPAQHRAMAFDFLRRKSRAKTFAGPMGAAPQKAMPVLSNEVAQLRTDVHERLRDAGSWESIYRALGQELWLSFQYLSSPDPALRRTGLQLAEQAREDALNDANNGWLAARICDGFLLPYLDAADAESKAALSRDSILNNAIQTFHQANEIRRFAELAQHVIRDNPASAEADRLRIQIGEALEEQDDLAGAVAQYRAVRNLGSFGRVMRRLPGLEAKLKAKAEPAR